VDSYTATRRELGNENMREEDVKQQSLETTAMRRRG
tara:strand:+ start:632 stop:739 length:108 start_codon:yes stop_codon:yes gene_type:complete